MLYRVGCIPFMDPQAPKTKYTFKPLLPETNPSIRLQIKQFIVSKPLYFVHTPQATEAMK